MLIHRSGGPPMPAMRFPLPKRFNVAMSESAYKELRQLNTTYGYGNNYLLTVILENFDLIVKKHELKKVFDKFKEEYGAPASGKMNTPE